MENAHFPPLPSFLLNSNPSFVRKLKPPGYSHAFEHIPELRSDPAVSRHTWGVVSHDFSHFSSIQSGDSTTNHESKTAKIHLPNWCLQGKCLQVPFTLEPAADVAKPPPEHIDLPPHGRSWSPRSMSDVSTLPHSKHPCMLATTSFDGFKEHFSSTVQPRKTPRAKAAEQMMEICGSFAANIPDTTHLRWKCSLHTALRAISSAWNCRFWSSHLDLRLLSSGKGLMIMLICF